MARKSMYSPEVQERAVRLVLEQRKEHGSLWASIRAVAQKIGCTPESLRRWVRQDQTDRGIIDGVSSADQQELKDLRREVKELRKANEILRLASAFFATAELDRPPRK